MTMHERDGEIPIRSFRVCFDMERRLHRIDRFRIPLPYGVPLRGLVYSAAILLAMLVLAALPIVGGLVGAVNPVARYVGLPLGVGYLLTELRVDGRSGHAVVASWLRLQLGPRRLRAFRTHKPPSRFLLAPILVALDERGPRLRRGVLHGRGRIYLRQPAQLSTHGRTLRVRGEHGEPRRRGALIDLRAGQRVVIA